MLNIVIPMAGRGSRFSDAGYTDPKPLIPVGGQPMIKRVIDNLTPSRPHRFIFICQREHVGAYGLRERLALWAPGSQIVELDGITEGAACTVLAARDKISDGPLMIANSDQYVDIDINDYLAVMDNELDGLIMTMTANDPKWSFAALDEFNNVVRVVEKEVISNEATVGIYNFSDGRDFLNAADRMIRDGKRVNGEYYVAPTYNELIAEGAKVRTFNIGSEGKGMYGLGTPADLKLFCDLGMLDRLPT